MLMLKCNKVVVGRGSPRPEYHGGAKVVGETFGLPLAKYKVCRRAKEIPRNKGVKSMTTFIIILLLIIINVFTVYKLLFNLLFNDMDDFKESIRFAATPDIYSLFKGKYMKDKIGEGKLGLFIILCAVVTIIEFSIVNYFL